MDDLRRLVRFARRRLILQTWFGSLPWCGAGGLILACGLLAVDYFFPLPAPAWVWPAAGAAAGLIAASLWAWRSRPGELEAALEIDRRFGLKERISSSYALDASALQSPAGQALAKDAWRSLERLTIATQFGLSPGRWLWLPVVPAAGALAIVFLLRPAVDSQRAAAAATLTAQQQQIERSTQVLRKKLEQQRQQAQQQGLKSADDLFARLEQGARQAGHAHAADRKQALIQLNDLAKELSQRQNELTAGRQLADQLRQLKGLGQGPAEKLAQALEQGNLAAAAREFQALAEQLKHGELDAAAREKLAAQLKDLQHKIEAQAKAQRQLEQNLKQEIADKRAAGRHAEADQLQQQLDRLGQQRQAQSLEKMADKLGQCAACLGRNQGDQAASELTEMRGELDDLNKQLAESEMIGQALDEISDAKEGMTCKSCAGAGCRECQGQGQGQRMGDGVGRGRGKVLGAENEGNTSAYDTHVRQKVGRGPAVAIDLVTGPNARGRVEQQIRSEWSGAAAGDEADPLTNQQLPAEYREHAKKYFDALREGR